MIYNSPQGSEQWLLEKAGHFSASPAYTLFMGKNTDGYNDLINKIALEKISGKPIQTYSNDDMLRGSELEPEAREQYSLYTFNKVTEIGFWELDEWVGMSSDGLVGEDKLLEIKCLKWNTHIRNLLEKKIDPKYMYQIQFQMMVSDRKYCDFFCYHPEIKPLLITVKRDEQIIDKIKIELQLAIKLTQERIKKISKWQ